MNEFLSRARNDAAVLRTVALSKSYVAGDREVPVLRDVNLEIAPGEFVAICGPSGSGKSTLLHLISGLERPTLGRVLIAGQDLAQMDDEAASRFRNAHIGFVFQNFHLLPLYSALENVALARLYSAHPDGAREAAAALLRRLGLSHRLAHKPNALSGGERQRVALARALINDPAIVFADEPTGSLDSRSGRDVLALLQEVNDRGTSVVLITHDAGIAAAAPRVINIADGSVHEDR